MRGSELDLTVSGITKAEQGSLAIILNSTLLHNAPADDVLATLLHHMIHAWFLITTLPEARSSSDEGPCAHGKAFGSVLYAIKSASSADKASPLPLEFENNLQRFGLPSHFFDPYRPMPRSRSLEMYDHSRHIGCSVGVKPLTKSECDKWFNEKCLPELNKIYVYKIDDNNNFVQSERTREESIELIWDKKNIAIPTSAIDKYSRTLGSHFSNKRMLTIPSWVKKDIFLALHSFLTKNGTYKPQLSNVQESNDADKLRASQFRAPQLREYKSSWPAHLLTDIKMYRLGRELRFDELCDAAVKRLEAQHFTHENVVDAIAEIYNPPSGSAPLSGGPEEPLRAWTRNFLKVASTGGGSRAGRSRLETSNLWRLREDPEYKYAWTRLLDKEIPALVQDFNAAYEELQLGTSSGTQTHPPRPVPSPPANATGLGAAIVPGGFFGYAHASRPPTPVGYHDVYRDMYHMHVTAGPSSAGYAYAHAPAHDHGCQFGHAVCLDCARGSGFQIPLQLESGYHSHHCW